jgi:hypothetical protein
MSIFSAFFGGDEDEQDGQGSRAAAGDTGKAGLERRDGGREPAGSRGEPGHVPESGVPLPESAVTIGRLERELGETPALASIEPDDAGLRVSDSELPVEDRRAHGIEDNVRHTSSLGRR